MLWRIALAAILTVGISWFGLSDKSHAQFNGCPPGFCNIAASSAPPPSDACAKVIQSGLQNCVSFDTANTTFSPAGVGSGTAIDTIGGKNVALTNVGANGSGPSTAFNNAGVCNGTTSQGLSTLNNLPTAAFSLLLRVNPTSLLLGGTPMGNDRSNNDNLGFWIVIDSGLFQLRLGLTPPGTAPEVPAGSTMAVTGSWQSLMWTYDGTTVKGYYGSSANVASATQAGAVGTPASNNIGFCYNPATGDQMATALAAVMIYTRALTGAEFDTNNAI